MKITHLIKRVRFIVANPFKRAELIRHSVFHMGENVMICTKTLGDLFLLSVGDNVIIAANARFIMHDASAWIVNRYKALGNDCMVPKYGAIVLKDNCFVGAYSTLLPGTSLGKKQHSCCRKCFDEKCA